MINIRVRFSGRVTCSLSHLEQTAGNGTAYQSARPMTSPASLEGPATGSPEAPQPLWETGPRLAGRKKRAPRGEGGVYSGRGGESRWGEERRGEEKETNGDPQPPCDGGADAGGAGTTSALSPRAPPPGPPGRSDLSLHLRATGEAANQSAPYLEVGGSGPRGGPERPCGKEPPPPPQQQQQQPAGLAALTPLCHGGRAAPGPAGDLPAGRRAQGAGESAPAGERGWGEVRERGAGGGSAVPAGRVSRPVCGAGSVSAGLSPVPAGPLPSARTRVRLWGCLVAVIIG